MRTLFCTAVLLLAVPALAADAQPAAPPSPPPVTYDVWGFQWNGQQFVKQATHSFSTSDIKQAADYVKQVNSFAGWQATTNMPEPIYVHTVFHDPTISCAASPPTPDQPTYTVWAFKLTDGKWVKDEKYSWTTPDPLAGLQYAQNVNAVPGWRTTTNCPQPVPQAERYVDGGPLQGAENYSRSGYAARGMTISIGGFTINLPPFQVTPGGGDNDDSGYTGMDTTSNYSDTSDIQNSIATQDMINNQTMFNNEQDAINTQNFNDTENMINNMQDMVNTQNAVNEQNMINAQNDP